MFTVAPPITIIDQTTDDTVPTSTVMPIYIQTNTPDDNARTVDVYTTSHDVHLLISQSQLTYNWH